MDVLLATEILEEGLGPLANKLTSSQKILLATRILDLRPAGNSKKLHQVS